MTTFRQTSKNGSKACYNFFTVGLDGMFNIDTISSQIQIVALEGRYKDNEGEINHLLHIAKSKLVENDFPKDYTYATH